MAETYTRPLPAADEVSMPYFEGAREGRLMLMRCAACGAWRFPSRDRCDVCWSTDSTWEPASGKGTVYTFGVMHQLYHPGFKDHLPYNVAVVELAEGPRMMTNIVGCPTSAIQVGMPVEVIFEPINAEITIPRFRPAS